MRIGPNELSFATITSQKTIYTNAKGETFCKAGIFQELAGQQIFAALNLFTFPTNNTQHSDLKRQLQPAFTNRALLEQESIHQLHLAKLISQLGDTEGKIINLPHYLNPMLWDVVGDLSFGEPLVPSGRGKFSSLKRMNENKYNVARLIHYISSTRASQAVVFVAHAFGARSFLRYWFSSAQRNIGFRSRLHFFCNVLSETPPTLTSCESKRVS